MLVAFGTGLGARVALDQALSRVTRDVSSELLADDAAHPAGTRALRLISFDLAEAARGCLSHAGSAMRPSARLGALAGDVGEELGEAAGALLQALLVENGTCADAAQLGNEALAWTLAAVDPARVAELGALRSWLESGDLGVRRSILLAAELRVLLGRLTEESSGGLS